MTVTCPHLMLGFLLREQARRLAFRGPGEQEDQRLVGLRYRVLPPEGQAQELVGMERVVTD